MRTINKTIYYPSRSDTFTLWHLTDLHIGHAGCDESLLKQDIAAIAADPNAYWGGGGDYCDFIPRKKDKRYQESSVAHWLHGKDDICDAQVERFIDLLSPIADKCLYMVTGNHEDSQKSHSGNDVYLRCVRGIARAAGKETKDIALGWEGFITLKFRRGKPKSYGGTSKVVVYAHHGAGGGRKQGGHALRLEEVLLTYDADLALLGHRHIRQIVNKHTVKPDGNGVKIRERVGVFCGSYLHTYLDADADGIPVNNYPQAVQLGPTTVGTVPIIIKPDQRRVLPLLSNGGAGEFAQLFATQRSQRPVAIAA